VRLAFAPLTLAFLAFPFQAGAMEITSFDFRGQVPAGWEAGGVRQAVPTPQGMRIQSTANGGITRPVDFTHNVESLTIHARAGRPTRAAFAWHVRGTPENEVPQMPFIIEASETVKEIMLPLTYYPQWSSAADYIGIVFQSESDVIIERLEFRGYSFVEKIEELIVGLWTFDEFRPYSINFLWGPLVSYTPAMRDTLYDTLPPFAHSITQWMYALLALPLAWWLWARARRSAKSDLAFGVLCAVFIGLWIAFDLRMGSEISTYALRDLKSYALAPAGEKQLRTHEYFFDVLNQALPEVQKHARFGLVTDENALYSLTRYRAYPSLPIMPDKDLSGITLWLVAYRPEATIDSKGRLMLGDTVLTGSGRIIKRLPGDGFLFSTAP
jgi:hypothetical protein